MRTLAITCLLLLAVTKAQETTIGPEEEFTTAFAEETTPEDLGELPVPPKEEKKENDCHIELSGPSGHFTSENFPENYKSLSNCSWNITVPEGKIVKVTFHLLNVEYNDRCVYDWVKVIDSNGTLLKQVCGSLSQDLVVKSTSNKIRVHFFSDGVVENKGFLASWQAVLPDVGTQNTESDSDGSKPVPSYVLTFPQSFGISEDAPPERICLQMSHVDANGDVTVDLLSSHSILSGDPVATLKIAHESGDSKIHCFDMKLPSDFSQSTAVLRIEAEFPDIDYSILSYKSVQALPAEPVVLIQTDKFDYRPKQDIRFRVLLLNSQLKPDAEGVLPAVWVEDPSDSRIAQWKNVATKKGIAQLTMPLPEEPLLGTYRIKVESNPELLSEATFTVSENVLPKFEVILEGPSVVLRDSPEETFKVCAKYTHGSNVKGVANVTFLSSYRESTYWRAPFKTVSVPKENNTLEQGCVEVILDNAEIEKLSEKTSEISALVEVTEESTGEKHNTTWKGIVSYFPFKMSFGSSSTEHIVGGFPYVGSLKVLLHNGTPKPNVKINLCARLFTDLDAVKDELTKNSYKFYSYNEDQIFALGEKLVSIKYGEVCNEYESGNDGAIDFSVPLNNISAPENVTTLSFYATAVDYPANDTTKMFQPAAKLDVSLTHTNLSAALTIHDADSSKILCSENDVVTYFSANSGDNLELNYFVTSGAAVIEEGQESIVVGGDDLMGEFIGAAHVLEVGTQVKSDQPKKILSKKVIQINRPFPDEVRISQKIKVLVYIKDSIGRTISATKEYTADSCLTNVTLSWSAEKLNPASPVSMKVLGNPNNLCGYSVVDKSVDLVANPNKITYPKIGELKEMLAAKRINNPSGDKCSNANLLFKAFERLGLYILSDSHAENHACDTLVDVTHLDGKQEEVYDDVPVPVAFTANTQAISADRFGAPPQAAPELLAAEAVDGGALKVKRPGDIEEEGVVEKPTIDLRSYFPETWLFDLVELDSEGQAVLDLETPHTITTWVGDAVCSDLNSGLLVSNKAELLVTQDFFVDLYMPFTVKRGEVFPLNVSVFNTVGQQLPMKVSLLASDDYSSDDSNYETCIDAKDSNIRTVLIKAKELDDVNITVAAEISSAAVPNCGTPGEADGYKDTIQKNIYVKPEGFPVEKVQSEFQCRSPELSDTEESIKLDALKLPSDLVDGSARAWVSVTGDVLAPALANLENLVTLPTGCGEQNMITLVPNIYLLEYLNGTGKSEPKLVDKALKYMRIGYDRQNEHYRHADGSYSVWGPSSNAENEGSMWLTAFVVKAFSQASQFIAVDTRLMQRSVDWILQKQSRKSGCIHPVGQMIHSEISGPEQSLTASVLVTLLEIKASRLDVLIDPAYIDAAVKCIVENPANSTDLYTRSLVAYALTLRHQSEQLLNNDKNLKGEFQKRETEGENPDETDIPDTLKLSENALSELLTQANTSMSGKLFWTTEDGSLSRSVEMTAYNTLNLIMHDHLAEALLAIKWMTTHRNSRGGFVSTSDTMVAMQALTQYSVRVSKETNDLTVTSVFGSEETPFTLNEDNLLLVQRSKLDKLSLDADNDVHFKVKGKGCFMVQTLLRYNVKDSPDKVSFVLTVKQVENDLKICASYVGDKQSTDMVVIEAELLSGFTPYEVSLEALLNEVEDPVVKKYEIDEKENKFVLYFDGMPKKETCWPIEVKREVIVENLKPAVVKIYDYYNTEDVFSTEYNLVE